MTDAALFTLLGADTVTAVLPIMFLRAILHLCSALEPAGPDGKTPVPSKYDLIANVVHEGKAGQQTGIAPYKAHIHRGVEKAWYEVQVRVEV